MENKELHIKLIRVFLILFGAFALSGAWSQENSSNFSSNDGRMTNTSANEASKESLHSSDKEEMLTISSSASLTIEKQQSSRISKKYRSGEYLIYDCRKRHFACVDQASYKECNQARERSKRDDHAIFSCAPLHQFPSLQLCVAKYYQLMHKTSSKIFCINSRELQSLNEKPDFEASASLVDE